MFVLFYKPPCGRWYVHSHKLYESEGAARAAAARFLTPGTPISIATVAATMLDRDAFPLPKED